MRIGIVGGGIAGMTAAALLGHEGHEVEVFEANSFLGGRASTLTLRDRGWGDKDGWLVDNGFHGLIREGYLQRSLRITGADRNLKWAKLKRPRAFRRGRWRMFTANPLVSLMLYHFVPMRDQINMLRLVRAIRRISFREIMYLWRNRSLEEFLRQYRITGFGRECTVDGWAVGFESSADVENVSAADWLLNVKLFFKDLDSTGIPMVYPHGGIGEICEALRKTIEARGGNVFCGKPVRDILIRAGQAQGLVFDDGEREYDCVLFAAPLYEILNCPEASAQLPESMKTRLMEAKNDPTYLGTLIIGANRTLRPNKPFMAWSFISPPERLSPGPTLWINEMAYAERVSPPGKVQIHLSEVVEGLDVDLVDMRRRIVADIERVTDFRFGRDVEWEFTGAFVGDAIQKHVDWFWDNRFDIETPIPKLYACGDACREYTTGMDGSASSAVLAAQKITGRLLITPEEIFD